VKIRATLLAAACSLSLIGVFAAPADAVVTTYNVGNDHAVCETLTGTIKFATKLTLAGPTTGAQTTTVKGTVAGCSDTDNANVAPFSGTLAATLSSNNGTSCAALLGPSNTAGTSRIIWKPATGQAFSPTVTIGTAQKPVSDITFSQTGGQTYTVAAGNGPWSGTQYGEFYLGAAYGLTAGSGTVDFKGGDNGASGWFAGTTQQSAGWLGYLCLTKGIVSITFGIGAVALG
jgi:hypothetical protein